MEESTARRVIEAHHRYDRAVQELVSHVGQTYTPRVQAAVEEYVRAKAAHEQAAALATLELKP